jgi:predicted AAA+ superfamily ATPase
MYRRDAYLDQLIRLMGTSFVKVITGVRRCGKSTLLDLFERHLLQNGVMPECIIRVNFELVQFDAIKDYRDLAAYIESRALNKAKIFILLDEVQQVTHWEKAVNSLRAGGNVDIYLTGSNASMLSSELATLLSGRYIEIKMLPLSFKEYLDFRGYTEGGDVQGYFDAYLEYGGFPGLPELLANLPNDSNEQLIGSFLDGIYNTILMKDVVYRNNIRDSELLEMDRTLFGDYEGIKHINIIDFLRD